MTRIAENTADIVRSLVRHEEAPGPAKHGVATKVQGSAVLDEIQIPTGPTPTTRIASGLATDDVASPMAIFGNLAGPESFSDLNFATIGQALNLEADLAPKERSLSTLANLQHFASAETDLDRQAQLLFSTEKVQDGYLLLLSDAGQSQNHVPTRASRRVAEHIAKQTAACKDEQKLVDAFKNATLANQPHLSPSTDINAYVEAVLRECYLLQTENLKDYADKVKFYNELKKKIRAQLQTARNLETQLKDGDQLPEDFQFTTFGDTVWNRQKQEAAPTDVHAQGETCSKSTPAPSLSDAALSSFQPALGPNFTASQKINQIAGMSWDDLKKFAFAGQSSFDFISANVGNLDVGAFCKLLLTTLAGSAKDHGWTKPTDTQKCIAETLINAATAEQLAAWYQTNPQKPTEPRDDLQRMIEKIVAMRHNSPNTVKTIGALDAEVNSAARITNDLPALSDPAFADLRALYSNVRVAGENTSDFDVLKWRLCQADPQSVNAFLKAISQDCPPPSQAGTALANDLLFACDPRKLFGSPPNLTDWAWLKTADGPAKDLYDTWYSITHPATTTQRPDNAIATNSPTADSPSGYTKAEMDAYVKTLEEELQGAGDDGQLANVDLQNALQHQQQTLTMMSNISKMLYDTAMSIIRKIGS